MTYAERLNTALHARFANEWLDFMPKWSDVRSTGWQGGGVPKALVLHHTAAASTSSVNPANPGNKRGADAGIVSFIQSHYEVPAANFTLLRWGGIVVHSAYPIWHAGLGSFKGTAWKSLGIPDNKGNDYMLGVEIVDKGAGKTITDAQWDSLKFLLLACKDASGWQNIGLLRRPQHRDWAPNRKVDLRYSNAEVTAKLLAV